MELQTIIVIESIILGLSLSLAALYFYAQSQRLTDARVFGLLSILFYFCLPGIVGAFSPSLLRIVIPIERPQVMVTMALALPILVFSLLIGLLFRFGAHKRMSEKSEQKLARQVGLRYRPGRLFFLSLAFFLIGLVGEYVEIHAVGGWLSVIRGGSSAYMEARVTQTVGFWGILITSIPIAAIGMMYSVGTARSVPRRLRWSLFVLILCSAVGLISLLTVRHQSVMLLLSLIALSEVRSHKIFRVFAPLALVLIVVGAIGLASFRYNSRTQDLDEIAANFGHIKVSEHVISAIQIEGYIWGGNAPELLTIVIPRALWSHKPMGNRINRVVFWEFASIGGVKTVGLLGEGYASGGLFFVALEGLLYGIMLRRLHGFWERRKANAFQFMAYGSIILGYIYLSAQSGFITLSLMTFFVMLAQVKITMWFAGYVPRQRSESSAVPFAVENWVTARAIAR